MEKFAISESCLKEIKILGTFKLKSGEGLNKANLIKSLLDTWEIGEKCIAMCFDTTASNTGKFEDATILLEDLLDIYVNNK